MPTNPGFFDGLSIDKRSSVPVFQQLVGKLNCIINIRQLKPGAILPPIRVLASGLGINPNTVARAYDELQAAGVIAKRRGSGCVVASSRGNGTAQTARAHLQARIEELIASAGAVGVTPFVLIEMIESCVAESDRAPTSKPEILSKDLGTGGGESSKPDVSQIWQPDDAFID